MSNGIFHKFLLEEYEKSGRKNLDFVGEKKKHFWNSVHQANDSLRSKNYTLAKELYLNVVNFINEDPYPDELNLDDEVIYFIKCCYCYSYILDYKNNSKESQSSIDLLHSILASLRCSYSEKMLPYYLQLRLDLEKQNLTSAACQCIMIRTNELKSCDTITNEVFKDLLPSVEEMVQLQKETFNKYKVSNGGISIATNTEINKTEKIIEKKNSEMQTETVRLLDKYVQSETIKCENWERSSGTQTEKVKSGNKHIQTEPTKCKNAEVQVSLDHHYLHTVQDIQRRILNLQEINSINAERLNNKVTEIQIKLDNDDAHNSMLLKESYERKIAKYELEVSRLRDALELSERMRGMEVEKCFKLQKSLLDQLHDKYIMQKTMCESLNAKSYFMISYLSDLLQYLCPTTIPDDISVKREIEFWQTQITMNNTYSVRLNNIYKHIRADLLHSNGAEIVREWPGILTFPKDEDSVIYSSFKPVIKHIMKTEDALMNMLETSQDDCSSSSNTNISSSTYYPSVSSMVSPNLNVSAGFAELPTQNLNPINKIVSHNYVPFPSTNQNVTTNQNVPLVTSVTPQPLIRTPVMPFPGKSASVAPTVPTPVFTLPTPTAVSSTKVTSGSTSSNFSDPLKSSVASSVPATNVTQTLDINTSTETDRQIKSTHQMSRTKQISKSVSSLNLLSGEPSSANTTGDVESDDILYNDDTTYDAVIEDAATSDVASKDIGASVTATHGVGIGEAACSLLNEPLREPSADVIAEDMLFRYIADYCPYQSEQEITLALLDVLEKHGGTFSNVSQRVILRDVREYFRSLRQKQKMKQKEIEQVNRKLDETCTICFELYRTAKIYSLPCQHVFHKHCIKKWVNKSALCPICRTPTGLIR